VGVVSESGGNVKWFVGAVLVPIVVACIGAGVAVSQGACLPLICSDNGPGPGPGSDETAVFLNQLSGPAGTEVLVSGTGFGSEETVTIRFHVDVVGSTTTDSTGKFANVSITVPDLPGSGPQQFSVTAVGKSSVRHAEAQFTLTD
jgi:hypothetical protein